MIIFEKVTKKFPLGNIALEDVSFKIDDNEFYFFGGVFRRGKNNNLEINF